MNELRKVARHTRTRCSINDALLIKSAPSDSQFGKYNSVICISECEDENCKSLICNSPEKIGESPIPQSSDSLLVEFPDGSVTISPYALFNRTSYTHILQLLPLKDDLMRTFYAFEAIREAQRGWCLVVSVERASCPFKSKTINIPLLWQQTDDIPTYRDK